MVGVYGPIQNSGGFCIGGTEDNQVFLLEHQIFAMPLV